MSLRPPRGGDDSDTPDQAPEKTMADSSSASSCWSGFFAGLRTLRTGRSKPLDPPPRRLLRASPVTLLALLPLLSDPSITGDGKGPPYPSKLLPRALLTELEERCNDHPDARCDDNDDEVDMDEEYEPRPDDDEDDDELRLEDDEVRREEEEVDAEKESRVCQLPEATLDAGDGPAGAF